jgi:thiol:disulfide interchange protein DsbD
VNERALADGRVEPELERRGFDVYRADWTRRDAAIQSALAALGKAGVPAYAVYAPAAPDRPQILPELLTADLLISALREVASLDSDS